jgi:hypothetical protein
MPDTSERVAFGTEVVQEAVLRIPGCDVSFDTMWMQMSMEATFPGSDYASISIAFLLSPDINLSANGEVTRHYGTWDEAELTITLPDNTSWKVHGIKTTGDIEIDSVEPA